MTDSIFRSFDSFNLHDHICHLYCNNSECLDIGSKFIAHGLKTGEKCLVIQNEGAISEFADRLVESGINLIETRRTGLLIETVIQRDEYQDSDTLIGKISSKINRLQRTRILINEERNGHEQTLLKESKLGLLCNKVPSVIMHQYNLEELNQKTLLDLFKSHNLLIIDNMLHNSSLYVNPAELIKRIEYDMRPADLLTAREKEVLKHLVDGNTNKKISRELGISARTVETHRNNIMKKLNARTIVDVVRFAIQNNIVEY